MKQQKQVPALRFPEFSGEWEKKKLGQICKIRTGNKDTKNKNDNGNYPFFVRSNTVERINSYSYDGEAILTSGDGVGVGKNFHYIIGKFDFHQRVYALTNFKKDFYGKYVFHFFSEKFFKRVLKLSAKNSVDSVRKDFISEMKIPSPTLPEQQKIAAFLSAVDRKIEQLQQKKSLLEQYKKGMMQKLFSQELRFKPDKETPTAAERSRSYPDWEVKKTKDIAPLQRGFDLTNSDTVEGDYPVVFSNGILKTHKEFKVIAPGVVTGRSGTIGKVSYIVENYWPHNTSLWVTDFKGNHPKFIYYFYCNFKLERFNAGSTVPTLNRNDVHDVQKTIPSIPEQQKIANFLSAIDAKIELVNTQIEKSQQFKKGLLQKMFV